MSAPEADLREQLVDCAHSLHARGLTHGSTGNLSVRSGSNILVTGTGTNLGRVQPDQLALIDASGSHIDGAKPSKEAFLHAALLRARPQAAAVVHTHSTFSTAVSCLGDVDPASALPPLTAYFAMRVGTLPLLPYFAPGDKGLEEVAEHTARRHSALLLRNHGPIVAAESLGAAMDALEEIEETAKLYLLLSQHETRALTNDEAQAVRYQL